MPTSFYWHDYETWGSDPRRDRPCQFAGLRTDADLNVVGEPLVLFCRPAGDLLPQPDACLVTGITPQRALDEGVPEAQLAAAVQGVLGEPGTCGVGYNSIRFDDEVTRHLLYRNLIDPYGREWQNGNSRWDLIDTLRMAHALRPEGIQWPLRDDGSASFRLAELTAANGIPHLGAHDALADVKATIGMARLLRRAQPRLFDYALTLRDKHRVRELLGQGRPLIHASSRFPAALGCIAPVIAVAPHPGNPNAVVCFDLREDPTQLAELPVEEIRRRLFTPAAELPEGVSRVPLKTVRVNHAPVLAPMKTLTAAAAERWAIDPAGVQVHARVAARLAAPIRERVQAVLETPADAADGPGCDDPDQMLYSGGFIPDADRALLERLRQLSPPELAEARPRFQDPRLPEMLLRYRARNWPETLSEAERDHWDAYRLQRLTDPDAGGTITIDALEARLAELAETHAQDGERLAILEAINDWAEAVMDAGD